MKNLLLLILAAVLLLSMTACGAEMQQAPEPYVPSADIAVALAFVDNGTTKVVTRRTSEKDINGFELCCVYFLSDGSQVGEAERINCEFENKGELSVWTFTARALSTYVQCAIAGVTYADGTKQSCPGVSTWVDETVKAFTMEGYDNKMAEMKNKEAAAAEKCDAAQISVDKPADGKVAVTLKNTSGKKVTEVMAYLLWFDANGAPIDMKGLLVPNARKLSAKTLAVDEEATFTGTAPEGAASVKGVVQAVTFEDGTVWENDYIYEWQVCNYKTAE